MALHLQKKAEVKLSERRKLEELQEDEDDFDEADRKAVEMYRQQRLQEWNCLWRREKYGELTEVCGEEYVKEVKNVPEDVWVVFHLYRSSYLNHKDFRRSYVQFVVQFLYQIKAETVYRKSIAMCLLVNEHLSLLARKYPEVKFLKAIVNSCILNYHDRYLPTILVYKTGEIKGRFIGVAECGGMYLKVEDLEWKLAEVGAVETDKKSPKRTLQI